LIQTKDGLMSISGIFLLRLKTACRKSILGEIDNVPFVELANFELI
jgi:hypothetical protein